ncbi:MAG: hypothetical protein LBL78_05685 [Prevotellaceae bacterium]|nr:hypothetical protein [Prevotellaceae bacterium]
MTDRLNSEFEKECLFHYLFGKGKQMTLEPDVFKRLSDIAVAKQKQESDDPLAGTYPVTIGGKPYLAKCMSLYDTEEFDYSLGNATVYFDANGTPVGLYDIYDFDPASHRAPGEEALVKLVNSLTAGIGKPYHIVYGIHA